MFVGCGILHSQSATQKGWHLSLRSVYHWKDMFRDCGTVWIWQIPFLTHHDKAVLPFAWTSQPTPARRAPSTGFGRVVVPTVANSARLLQSHGLLARTVFPESLLVSVPPEHPMLQEAGLGASPLPIFSSTGATSGCGAASSASGMIQALVFWRGQKFYLSLAQALVALRDRCEEKSMSPCFRTWLLHHSLWAFRHWKVAFDVALHERSLSVQHHASSCTQDIIRHHHFPAWRNRETIRASQLHIRGTQITTTFSKVPWTTVFFTSADEREELSICWHFVTLHTQNPRFGSVNSAVIISGPTPTNSCCLYLRSVFHCRHRRTRRLGLSCLSLLPDASGSLPTCGLSCHSGDTHPQTLAGLFYVSGTLCSPFGHPDWVCSLSLRGVLTPSIPFPCLRQQRQRPSLSYLHCELLLAGLPLQFSELLRAVGALPPVPGPTAPLMPCLISTTIQHNRPCMDLTNFFLDSSWKGCAHEMLQHSRTLTDQQMSHKQKVYKKSRSSLHVVWACTTSTETSFILVWVCLMMSTYFNGIGNVSLCGSWSFKRGSSSDHESSVFLSLLSPSSISTFVFLFFCVWFQNALSQWRRDNIALITTTSSNRLHLLARGFPLLAMTVLDEFRLHPESRIFLWKNTSWLFNLLT